MLNKQMKRRITIRIRGVHKKVFLSWCKLAKNNKDWEWFQSYSVKWWMKFYKISK